MKFRATSSTDFYKIGHIRQYPKGTEEVYSNMTARSNKYAKKPMHGEDFVINFGLQYCIKDLLIDKWNESFFHRDVEDVIAEYERKIKHTLGPQYTDSSHFRALHELGFLPIEIKALPEGEKVPVGVPLLTIKNTLPEFFWLTNFLETSMSCYLWKMITSATTAYQYRNMFEEYAGITGGSKEFVPIQGHDFSFRGMGNVQDAAMSGAGHLTSFIGTDSIPGIDLVEDYYHGNVEEGIGGSVPATEHSVMCMGGELDELETFRKLIMETYPTGVISIVSDTWDFWKVIREYLPALKDEIMARDGKVVIRPDSGDPVKIICGDKEHPAKESNTYKGAVEALWNTFGGTTNEKGFRTLDSHIGLIYGDSITPERAKSILSQLYQNKFASDNVVLGIGSYTYQYVTRDTHGFAIKSTAGKVNGERREIFKDPKTDDGMKKSAKGLLRVEKGEEGYPGRYVLFDQQTPEQEEQGELQPVFINGILVRMQSIDDIRDRINNS